MSGTPRITDPTTWALDREIVLVRVLDASRDAVFAAWTDADAFCQWFGQLFAGGAHRAGRDGAPTHLVCARPMLRSRPEAPAAAGMAAVAHLGRD